MGDAHSIGAKLWLTAAWFAAGLVVVVALGSVGLGVFAHLEHRAATRKANGLEDVAREAIDAARLGFVATELPDEDPLKKLGAVPLTQVQTPDGRIEWLGSAKALATLKTVRGSRVVSRQTDAAYERLGFSSWESRASDEENLAAMRARASRHRDTRRNAFLAAPLILLLGLGFVFGLYRWGKWLVR